MNKKFMMYYNIIIGILALLHNLYHQRARNIMHDIVWGGAYSEMQPVISACSKL